jgi:adenine-specific DNA methylase
MSSILNRRLSLIDSTPVFPSTRFQGSKLKLVDWIWGSIEDLKFQTALDAFGGTGCVGHMLKTREKKVTYNDILKFNWYIGQALIENDSTRLNEDDVAIIITRHKEILYPSFIQDTFKDIYFTDEENRWLDTVVTNIGMIKDKYKKAIAYFALFQACIIKRPFNLFHRKNLYIRLSDVERNFGNKATWDTPFETHFRNFVAEANKAVFSNGQQNTALNMDVFDIKENFDLVYIDTPYISQKGVGVDYYDFYHFLEGLVDYSKWDEMIDYRTKHRRLKDKDCVWVDKNRIKAAFDKLFDKFKDSIIVVSYRSDGIPSIEELKNLLGKYKPNLEERIWSDYKYVLSNGNSEEILLIGR